MTQTIERTVFTDMGFRDILIGSELFRALKISEGDMLSPITVSQIQEIANFLNDDIDPMFTIDRLSRSNKNPSRSNIEHFSSFIKLSNNKQELKKTLEEVDRQLEFYG